MTDGTVKMADGTTKMVKEGHYVDMDGKNGHHREKEDERLRTKISVCPFRRSN